MPLVATRSNAGSFGYGWGKAVGAADAMTAIASTTLSSATTTVTFSSIPGTYDDLLVVAYGRNSASFALTAYRVRFNSDSANNYSTTLLRGNGTSAASSVFSSIDGLYAGQVPAASATSNIFGAMQVHILNYANTAYNKTVISRFASDLNGSGQTGLFASLWRSTNAISSISITSTDAGNFVSGSVFALYGIKKAA